MVLRRLFVLFAALGACAPEAAPVDGGSDARLPRVDSGLPPAPETTLTHTFPAIDLGPGDERLSLCQAWTLGNEEPIYVDSVTMDADPGWHHSNWTWSPDTEFDGPDGTFPCRDRDFDSLRAVLVGGGVFFAQSTQATHEVQAFGPGAAYVIEPHARIIGQIHVLNPTADPVSTSVTFTVHGLPSDEVSTLLRGLAFDNTSIAIGPRSTTRVDMSCDLMRPYPGDVLDFRIHYVLPHYHGLATGFELAVVGGPNDGTVVYGTTTDIGDPLGGRIDPPLDLSGATGLRMTCLYENPTDTAVGWGVNQEDEMCVVLAYTDASREIAGAVMGTTETTTEPDGTVVETAPCAAYAL